MDARRYEGGAREMVSAAIRQRIFLADPAYLRDFHDPYTSPCKRRPRLWQVRRDISVPPFACGTFAPGNQGEYGKWPPSVSRCSLRGAELSLLRAGHAGAAGVPRHILPNY